MGSSRPRPMTTWAMRAAAEGTAGARRGEEGLGEAAGQPSAAFARGAERPGGAHFV